MLQVVHVKAPIFNGWVLKEYYEEARGSAVTQEAVGSKVGLDPLDQGAKVRVTNAVSDTFPRAITQRTLNQGKWSVSYKNLRLYSQKAEE